MFKSLLLLAIASVFIYATREPKIVHVKEVIIVRDTISILVPVETDVYLLARLIESESSRSTKGLERLAGRVANGEVVINRMKDNLLKGKTTTLLQTIYKRKQFDGVKTKRFKEVPSKESLTAAIVSILGISILPENIKYFRTPNAPNVWNKNNLMEWFRFAGHSYEYNKPRKT